MKVFMLVHFDVVVVGIKSFKGQAYWVKSADIMRVQTYHLEI